MPLEGDDFRWEQDAIRDALKGILHYYALPTSGHLILSGCAIGFASGNASITEGYVCINFEVCYVPAHTVPVSSLANSSLKIVETYDPTGLEVFADSVSRDTYAIRRALISDGLAGSNEIVLSAPTRLEDRLNQSVSAMTSPVTALASGWTSSTGIQVNKFLNQVLFQGIGNTTQPASDWLSHLVCTIPVGFRPATPKFYMVDYYGVFGGPLDVLLVEILPSGEVRASHVIRSATAGSSIAIAFNLPYIL